MAPGVDSIRVDRGTSCNRRRTGRSQGGRFYQRGRVDAMKAHRCFDERVHLSLVHAYVFRGLETVAVHLASLVSCRHSGSPQVRGHLGQIRDPRRLGPVTQGRLLETAQKLASGPTVKAHLVDHANQPVVGIAARLIRGVTRAFRSIPPSGAGFIGAANSFVLCARSSNALLTRHDAAASDAKSSSRCRASWRRCSRRCSRSMPKQFVCTALRIDLSVYGEVWDTPRPGRARNC